MIREIGSRAAASHLRSTSPLTSRRALRDAAWALALVGLAMLSAGVADGQVRCEGRERTTIVEVAGRAFLAKGQGLVELPSLSAGCLGCHDGTAGPSVLSGPEAKLTRLTAFSSGGNAGTSALGAEHPVDVLYPLGSDAFVPRGQLDPRLALADGRITCRTCHPSSATGLALPLARSELCLACHLK